MRTLLVALVAQSVISPTPAALKQIEMQIRPVDHTAVMTYKTTPQGNLKITVYFPPHWQASDRRSTILFFFAGSCATGNPAQFATTAKYFAARGMVATTPEYRIESIHHTPPEQCIEDGKSAIRWVRMNAEYLGIDRQRVIASGGSSGASMAAFAAYNSALQPDNEDQSISSEPNALVLLNPAFGCPPGQAAQGAPCDILASWNVVNVVKGGPPAILFYGTEDPLQDGGRDFARRLTAAGTRAEFYTAVGQEHGFFNRFPDAPWHALVLRQIDLFLASLRYLSGKPTVKVPPNTTMALHREPL